MNALDHHGTKLHQLKPGSIVTAAKADLKLARKKREGDANPFLPYSFHRRHVGKAFDAIDLLQLALKERDRGIASSKRVTRAIYGDEELLRDALVAARAA
jgi:hypothetical protein